MCPPHKLPPVDLRGPFLSTSWGAKSSTHYDGILEVVGELPGCYCTLIKAAIDGNYRLSLQLAVFVV